MVFWSFEINIFFSIRYVYVYYEFMYYFLVVYVCLIKFEKVEKYK